MVLVEGYPPTMAQGRTDHATRIDSPKEVMTVEATLNNDPIPNALLRIADLHYRPAADII
jgi:hypothetical protein